uniref:Uncharacterized protein n=1 Tax=Salix viminalis TaxID=40686 RepID=A0A6N2MWM7_SALVM
MNAISATPTDPHSEEGGSSRILQEFPRRFPCNFIPALVEEVLVNSGRISGGLRRRAWPDFGAGGIKSRRAFYYSRPSTFNCGFSDGIRCISAGMNAPVSTRTMKCCKRPPLT